MGRNRRTLRTAQEVRSIFKEDQFGYVMINNHIFDQFYEVPEHPYPEYKNKHYKENKDKDNPKKKKMRNSVQFSDLDLITFVFLKFMSNYKFTLYLNEIADYLQCSEKQLKLTMEKLQTLQGDIFVKGKERTVTLVHEKEYVGFNNGKSMKLKQWFINFDCNTRVETKDGEEVAVPYEFFMVTINDLDLLTSGKLTRREFIVYLFLLRIYTFDGTPIFIKHTTIGERLNIKLYKKVDSYIKKLETIHIGDVPLISIEKPRNYEEKLLMLEEPSCSYLPAYNLMRVNMMRPDNENNEVHEEITEPNLDKMEPSLSKNGTELELVRTEDNINRNRTSFKRHPDFDILDSVFE